MLIGTLSMSLIIQAFKMCVMYERNEIMTVICHESPVGQWLEHASSVQSGIMGLSPTGGLSPTVYGKLITVSTHYMLTWSYCKTECIVF